jgi:hypothetical protein
MLWDALGRGQQTIADLAGIEKLAVSTRERAVLRVRGDKIAQRQRFFPTVVWLRQPLQQAAARR